MIKWTLSTRRFDNKHHQGDLQCLEFEEGSIWGEIKPNVSGPGYVFVVMNGNSPIESGKCESLSDGKARVEKFVTSKQMSLGKSLSKKLAAFRGAYEAKEFCTIDGVRCALYRFSGGIWLYEIVEAGWESGQMDDECSSRAEAIAALKDWMKGMNIPKKKKMSLGDALEQRSQKLPVDKES